MENLHNAEGSGVPQMPTERIVSAAVRYGDDIGRAPNHALAIVDLDIKLKGKGLADWRNSGVRLEDGFITSDGKFVDRARAAEIADLAGQTTEDDVDSRVNPNEMDSSELLH